MQQSKANCVRVRARVCVCVCAVLFQGAPLPREVLARDVPRVRRVVHHEPQLAEVLLARGALGLDTRKLRVKANALVREPRVDLLVGLADAAAVQGEKKRKKNTKSIKIKRCRRTPHKCNKQSL
jgi:hypothetical protein